MLDCRRVHRDETSSASVIYLWVLSKAPNRRVEGLWDVEPPRLDEMAWKLRNSFCMRSAFCERKISMARELGKTRCHKHQRKVAFIEFHVVFVTFHWSNCSSTTLGSCGICRRHSKPLANKLFSHGHDRNGLSWVPQQLFLIHLAIIDPFKQKCNLCQDKALPQRNKDYAFSDKHHLETYSRNQFFRPLLVGGDFRLQIVPLKVDQVGSVKWDVVSFAFTTPNGRNYPSKSVDCWNQAGIHPPRINMENDEV